MLLLYNIVNVTVRFSHSFSSKCIGYNMMHWLQAHGLWLHYYTNTVGIVTSALHRETMTKS